MHRQVYCGTLQELLAVLLATATLYAAGNNAASPTRPTFTKDVAPILYSKCVQCHRAGDIAPMQLQTY